MNENVTYYYDFAMTQIMGSPPRVDPRRRPPITLGEKRRSTNPYFIHIQKLKYKKSCTDTDTPV